MILVISQTQEDNLELCGNKSCNHETLQIELYSSLAMSKFTHKFCSCKLQNT